MQKREKILAGLLGAVVIGWFGLPLFESAILAPIQDLKAQRDGLEQQQAEKHRKQIELAGKGSKLGEWRKRSLPPNPLNAQRLYQEWLTTLAQLSGFEITKITLENRSQAGTTYYSIPVKIEAKATLQELATFLQRFNSADLLHRIDRCDITSPASEGDPELTIILVAEGVSMTSAPERARLFEQTELVEGVNKSEKTIKLAASRGFPEELPFLVRIGDEFVNVTAREGDVWTVQRGVERTFSTSHEVGEPVEYFPVRPRTEAEEATLAMWSRSLFTKPAPTIQYEPKLANSPPTAVRGQRWNWTLEISGWNPAFGAPSFQLLSGPEKMELDERKGTLTWNVNEQTESGEYPVQVLVWGSNGKNAGFVPQLNVRVRRPNEKPRLDTAAPLRFFVGRESRIPIKATDPDGTALKYSLTQSPPGMTIDASSGELRWKPEDSATPGPVEVTIQVVDTDEAPETVSRKFPASVEEDSARFTYLTGRVGRSDGSQEAWLFDRITNRNLVVREGDHVNIADFEMTIEKIHPDHVVVRRFDQLWRLDFETPLVQMRPLPSAPPVRPLPPEAAAVPAPATSPVPQTN